MIDADGFDATQEEFYQPRPSSWIEVYQSAAGWIYRKVVDNQLLPVYVMTQIRVHAVTYAQFVEMVNKKPYAQVIDGYRNMATKEAE